MRISDLVLENNHHWIAFNKPAGMPVQADPSQDADLSTLAQSYCKRNLHLLNRIDRPASGVVLFTKTDKIRKALIKQWQEEQVQKIYYAITAKGDIPLSGVWEQYLTRNKNVQKAHISDEKVSFSKLVKLKYQIVATNDNYQLWEINLVTGRFHQIRAQLAHAGFPIRGDVKYGFKRSMRKHQIFLHAQKLTFIHPLEQKTHQITAPLPDDNFWTTFNYSF